MFHDAPIVTFAATSTDVTIGIESFSISETQDHPAATLRITGIRRTLMDGVEVRDARSSSQDGEILRLKRDAAGIDVFVQWSQPDHRSEVVHYRFDGGVLQVEGESE